MSKKELRKRAFQSINAEKSKQQTYDELKEFGGSSQLAVANLVRNIPTLKSRQKYKNLILVFIFCLGLIILQVLIRSVITIMENGFQGEALLVLFPLGLQRLDPEDLIELWTAIHPKFGKDLCGDRFDLLRREALLYQSFNGLFGLIKVFFGGLSSRQLSMEF